MNIAYIKRRRRLSDAEFPGVSEVDDATASLSAGWPNLVFDWEPGFDKGDAAVTFGSPGVMQ